MLGIFNALIQGMSDLLKWLYQLTVYVGLPNYGLAIILLTILVKIVLSPLYFKQMKSMRMMQQLQPKIKEMQSRYKEDPKKMQEKVMEIYRDHNVNPMAGCLPLIIQMPILLALYRALLFFHFTDSAHAGFLWIHSLSLKDPYFIMPILAALTTYWQSRMTTSTADPTQRTMLITMPLVFGYIASTVPSGLGLYWVMFNLTGVAQQYIVNRLTPEVVKEVSEVVKEVKGVADNRKDGKDRRGGSGRRTDGTKPEARTGGSRGNRGGNKRYSGSSEQAGAGESKD